MGLILPGLGSHPRYILGAPDFNYSLLYFFSVNVRVVKVPQQSESLLS